MLPLPMFLVKKTFFSTNTENHNIGTRQRYNLYLPQANVTIHKKRAYYSGTNIFNNLPREIKYVTDILKKV
jgi:hypothetical protein